MVNKYILDAKQFGVSVSPPDINKSEMNFSVYNDNILFGLSAIKGIGETLAETILENRKDGYRSTSDLIERIQPTKSQVVALIKSGAIPTKNKRKSLIRYLKSLYVPKTFKPVGKIPTYQKLQYDWDIDIEKYRTGEKKYDYDKDALLNVYNQKRKEQFDVEQEQRFQKFVEENNKYLENEPFWEFEALQIFINNNPFDKAYKFLSKFEDVETGDKCTLVGVIAKVQKKKDKAKKQFAFINIYSTFGLIEGIVWHTQLKEYESLIKNGQQIAVLGKKEGEDKVVVEKIKPYCTWLEEIRERGVHDKRI